MTLFNFIEALLRHVEEVKWVSEAIAALVGAATAALTFFVTRRKANADFDAQQTKLRSELLSQIETLTDQATKLQDRFVAMQSRVLHLEQKNMELLHRVARLEIDKVELQRRVQVLEAERKMLWKGITLLVQQIQESGLEPVWKPPEEGRKNDSAPPFAAV